MSKSSVLSPDNQYAISLEASAYKVGGQKVKTHKVQVGEYAIGGGAPILVQSMTNTDTADVTATVEQVIQLARAGSELVRITVNSPEAAAQVATIRERLDKQGCTTPLIGDFHYNGHRLLSQYPDCAAALGKYRLNPGNVGRGKRKDEQFATIIEIACRYDKPVRIGVNGGSLDQKLLAQMMDANQQAKQAQPPEVIMRAAMVRSAIESAQQAQSIGLAKDKIVLSCKMSQVQDLVAIYQDLSARCDYPLHLGLTEAGMGTKGIVASSVALAILLQQGIGDTIRISLTPDPGGPRTQEVVVAQELLQSLGLRSFAPAVTACPGCGRTSSTYFQTLAQKIQSYLKEQMPTWCQRYPGVEEMKVAVMGCVVNGPGESKMANIGISLPGTGESPVAPVFIDGERHITLKGERIAESFQQLVDDYVERNYGGNARSE